MRLVLVAVLAITLGACSSLQPAACRNGEQPLVQDALYFGTARPGGIVSREEWLDFLRGTLTPKFPEGLTTWAASGQWRSADGKITNEDSHVVHLVHADDAANDKAVQEVMRAYRSRFQQEAVLRVRVPACVSFGQFQ